MHLEEVVKVSIKIVEYVPLLRLSTLPIVILMETDSKRIHIRMFSLMFRHSWRRLTTCSFCSYRCSFRSRCQLIRLQIDKELAFRKQLPWLGDWSSGL